MQYELRDSVARPRSASVVLPRPRGHNLRWGVVAIITVLAITNYLDRGNLSVAAPQIMHDLGISNTSMGVILSAFVWPYAVMNLPAGWLIDRYGARLTLALAAGLWSIVAICTGFAHEVMLFVGLRIALGVSEAPLFPAAFKATNAWFPDQEKALATGIYIAATQVGLAIAPPLASVLMVHFGWPGMFVIMGAIGLIALVGWLVFYREPARHPRLHADELHYIATARAQREVRTEHASSKISMKEWFGLFRHPTIWFMVVGGASLQYVFWFYISWLPTYLERVQGYALNRVGFMAALPYIAGGIAVLLGGRLSDAFIARGAAPLAARRYVIAGAALLTACMMFATAWLGSSSSTIVLLTLGMFAYSLSSGNYWTLAGDVAATPRLVASIGAIQNFGGFIGGACAPIVTGILVDHYGGFVPALSLAGGLALLSAFMYAVALRHRLPA